MSSDLQLSGNTVAVHEAGHVVAAVLLGHTVLKIAVEPGGPGVTRRFVPTADMTDARRAHERLFVCLAGIAAVALYTPEARPDASLGHLLTSPVSDGAGDDLKETIHLLREPPFEMPDEDIRSAVREAFRLVRRYLREHQEDVRRVTDYLPEQGELFGEELDELLAGLDAAGRSVNWPDDSSGNPVILAHRPRTVLEP